MNQNTKPFMVMHTKDNSVKTSIYDDGRVYGKENGELLGIMTPSSIEQIKSILNSNMYMFRKEVYYKENHNPYILRIRDDSRKHRPIKVVGWRENQTIKNILCNKENWQYVCTRSCI